MGVGTRVVCADPVAVKAGLLEIFAANTVNVRVILCGVPEAGVVVTVTVWVPGGKSCGVL